MGKFISTQYFDTQDSIVKMNEELVNNPFYLYNDKFKSGTKVRYYNINTEKSTLDPGSKLAYTDLGEQSPIRYNVIEDFYIYQFIKAELSFDNDEFGLTANQLEGESYILPNTITPYDGDYFEVDHIKDSTWLFKVIDAERDTLENGSNVWKIKWVMDRTNHDEIVDNVVDEYQYLDVKEGTNVKAVVEKTKFKSAEKLDSLSITLANYFKDLFYDPRVQTFTYKWYNESNMYDPFAIEFIIRNNILNGTDEYTYVGHQTNIPATFSLDYNKSIFRAFELQSIDKLMLSSYKSTADLITSKVGIFHTRYEEYFALNYKTYPGEPNTPYAPKGVIPILEEEFVEKIVDNDTTDLQCFKRLIVKFFNNEDLCEEDIDHFEDIDLESNKDCFYLLLFMIYCIDFYTKKLLS